MVLFPVGDLKFVRLLLLVLEAIVTYGLRACTMPSLQVFPWPEYTHIGVVSFTTIVHVTGASPFSAGVNPEKKPPSTGWQGVSSDVWMTEWFYASLASRHLGATLSCRGKEESYPRKEMVCNGISFLHLYCLGIKLISVLSYRYIMLRCFC